MLTNKITFARLMALLRSIDPNIPLPDELEPYLWKHMFDHGLCKKAKRLEEWGETPKNSYYVVTGIVIIFCFDKIGDRHTFRIYSANSIVAMECFMKHEKSEYMIWQCRGSIVLSISYSHMQEIYKMMNGMELMAERTASAFNNAKERLRATFLAYTEELRVLKFYQEFDGLLPPRRSPVLDEDIASYVVLKLESMRRWRSKLIKEGRL